MPEHHKNATVPALVESAGAFYLLLVDDRDPEVRREQRKVSAKALWGDAEDGEGMLVELNDAAYDAAVILKMRVPVGPGQHDVRCAVGATLVGPMEETSEKGLNSEHIEIIAADFLNPGAGDLFAGVEARRRQVIGGHAVKGAVAVAQIEVVRIRLSDGVEVAALDGIQALRLRHIQGAQDERIHDAEDYRVGADGESQGSDGGEDEAGRFAQHAEGEAKILEKGFDGLAAEGCVRIFTEFLVAAELDAGAAFRFGAGQAGALEIVGAELDVGAEFLFRFDHDFGAVEEFGSEGAKIGQEFHTSSSRAVRTAVMASARRVQPSVSSRRRLRPVAVSS